jgi:hypothetical protein
MTAPESTARTVKKTQRRIVITAVVAGVIVLGTYAFWWYRYRVAIGWQAPILAGAVLAYHEQYCVLPPSVQALRDSRLYGLGATRLPGHIWEGWNEHTGPDVLYLPVDHWDGKAAYIIAVQPPVGLFFRGYVVAGDPNGHGATERELAEILACDDELRAATSQPGRWSQMPWKSPSG